MIFIAYYAILVIDMPTGTGTGIPSFGEIYRTAIRGDEAEPLEPQNLTSGFYTNSYVANMEKYMDMSANGKKENPVLQKPYREFTCSNCKIPSKRFIWEGTHLTNPSKNEELCSVCLPQYTSCQNCSIYSNIGTNVGTVSYCPACTLKVLFDCGLCHLKKETYSRLELERSGKKLYVCRDCFDEEFFQCVECGKVDERGGETVCPACNRFLHHKALCESSHGITSSGCRHISLPTEYRGEKKGKIITIDRTVGVELEAEDGDEDQVQSIGMPRGVDVGSDGSLDETGVEVRTPPASLDKLEEIIERVTHQMRKCGYRGTTAAGCHIHIGLKDVRDGKQGEEKIRRIVRTFYAIEDLLFSMLPPSRWNNRYCQSLFKGYTFNAFKEKVDETWYRNKNKNSIASWKRDHGGGGTRYSGLNLHSLYYRGTIEFRYHSGTVSAEKILNWAQLLLLLVDYATTRYQEGDIEELFNMATSEEKLEKLFNLLSMGVDLRTYIKSRIAKFNPHLRIQFNKGDHVKKTIDKEEWIGKNEKVWAELSKQQWYSLVANYHIDEKLVDKKDKEECLEKVRKAEIEKAWKRANEGSSREEGFIDQTSLSRIVNRLIARRFGDEVADGEDREYPREGEED